MFANTTLTGDAKENLIFGGAGRDTCNGTGAEIIVKGATLAMDIVNTTQDICNIAGIKAQS